MYPVYEHIRPGWETVRQANESREDATQGRLGEGTVGLGEPNKINITWAATWCWERDASRGKI